jgi:hypothetical protein
MGIFGPVETGSNFTTTENTPGTVTYVSSYRGQAGVIAASSAASFIAGSPFNGYGVYDNTTGGGYNVTLPAGTWRAAFRDTSGTGDNNAQAIKFTSRPTFSGCTSARQPDSASQVLAPGQSYAKPFSILPGEKMYMFGVNNSQFNIWLIPADQTDNAMEGRAFTFMKGYSCSYPCGGYPNYQQVDLPPGNYAIFYRHVSSAPGRFTVFMEWLK